MKKMLVCDYDDTFYLNDDDIKLNQLKVDEFRKKGNIFVFATGRCLYDFKKAEKKYNLKYDYLILNHGANIYGFKCNTYIESSIINSLKIDLELEKAIKYFCCSKKSDRATFDDEDITKIYVKYENIEICSKICDLIKSKYKSYVNCIRSSNYSIEIVNKTVSKLNSINKISNKLGFDLSNIYTIGDSYSDIDMIKSFKGFCMVNSVDELKCSNIKKYDSVSKLIEDILSNKV